jgi:tetratricopeptide (TPR) repeat protein
MIVDLSAEGTAPGRGPGTEARRRIRWRMEQIREALRRKDELTAITLAGELLDQNGPVPEEVYLELGRRLRWMVRDAQPSPQDWGARGADRARQGVWEAGRVLRRLWYIAQERNHDEVSLEVGGPLYQWYQRERRHEEARAVLESMIDVYRRRGNRSHEAVMVNNYGFQYWLEGDLEHAAVHFEHAAVIQEELGNRVEAANARVNYWACRFEAQESQDLDPLQRDSPQQDAMQQDAMQQDAMMRALRDLADLLETAGDWRERKACFYLARLEEARGNLPAAVSLLQRCVSIGEAQNPMYLHQDLDHLTRLTELLAANERE